MCESQDRLFDASGKSFTILHNVRGKGIGDWARSFRENEQHRLRKRKNSVYLNHEIISFHRDDSDALTLPKLESLVREYIQLRNPNGCYVAVPHFDRFHVHVHICSSAVQFRTGESMRMSRGEFALLKKNIQDFQQKEFPELSRSVVRHGRKADGVTSDKEVQYMLRTGKLSKRDEVREAVQECKRRAATEVVFYALLKARGMDAYVRGGKVYGVIYSGRRYRFTNLGIETNVINTQSLKRGIDKKKYR
jgi:Relaxase/Mobilisation nuclease domain